MIRWTIKMNSRSSLFVLAVGFGILLVLIATLGFGAVERTDTIYREMQAAQDSYSRTETFRRGVVLDMYLADILVRDYLLDPSPQNAPSHRQELLPIRDSLQDRLNQLSGWIPENDSPRLQRYRLKSRLTGIRSTRSLNGHRRKKRKEAGFSSRARYCLAAKPSSIWLAK